MKRALISDIHGNLEALDAVLHHIRAQDVREIFCLGDVIGYGPNPCECLDVVIDECRLTILGNHDHAVLTDAARFNPVALRAVNWTREQLNYRDAAGQNNRRLVFLGQLPRSHNEGEFLFVHGSPRDATNEYVFPEDVDNQWKMEDLFGSFERYCFQGHTHIPGVFTAAGKFVSPAECDYKFRLGEEKVMVNIGSVGQPRDGDPRASYVILSDAVVEFHRVDYPLKETARKIYNTPGLDDTLGDRLADGR